MNLYLKSWGRSCSGTVKITFVRPGMTEERSFDTMEPLVFGVLAGLTPPDVELALYDEQLDLAIPYDEPTDLVALTVETYTAKRAYQISTQFRQREVPIVMGGYHPTFLPEEALRYADSVVVTDAEGVWERVVQDAKEGTLKRIYGRSSEASLAGLTVDRSIFQGKKYAPIGLVQYGRGCRFACDFCSIRAFYGSYVAQRPVREVVAEIEALNRKLIFFVDDNIFSNVAAAEELFRALIPLRIRWTCQVSIDVAANPSLMDLMAESGCVLVLIGFESLDKRNLTQMKKEWNLKHGGYASVVKKFHDRGIMIYGTFILGYDHDTVDSFSPIVEFALRSKLCLANFNPLTPTPGTRLYDRLQTENRLIYNRWWLDDRFRYGQALYHPRGMTAEQLTEECFWARREFNKYSSILKRASNFRANSRSLFNLGAFFAANLISRKEIYRKQGLCLGDGTPLEAIPEGS